MISSKPSQYKKGWVEFYKLRFRVTPNVLIPRPETELLVDEVLKNIKEGDTVLDLGTGAGNIAISLACSASGASSINIIATDISEKALKVAKQNAKLHGVEDRIKFIKNNLLSFVIPANAGIQKKEYSSELDPDIRRDDSLVIVTNLPYIPSARIPYLDSSVKDFEPYIALDGGEDGFELYKKLFAQIKEKGWKPKLVIGEIDYTHGELAVNEAQKYFPEAEIEVKKDLTHLQRILIIKHSLV